MAALDVKVNEEGTFIEIDGRVRIERGHARRVAVATEELLSDENTASHYHAPKQVRGTTVHALDSKGKKIEIGKPMSYIDYKSQERVWNVYQLVGAKKVKMLEGPTRGEMFEIPDWQPVKDSPFKTKDEAMIKAVGVAMTKTI